MADEILSTKGRATRWSAFPSLMAKRSAQLRQKLARSKWVAGIIGVADSDGMVTLEPGVVVPLTILEQAVREYAKDTGGSVESQLVNGRPALVYHGPPEAQPPLSVANADDARSFERHPFFHRRLKIAGREAFLVRGPEEPRPGAITGGVLVGRRGALFVALPEQPEARRWFRRSYLLEYVVDGNTAAQTRYCDRIEHQEAQRAAQTLIELGLQTAEHLPDEPAVS